MKLEQYIKENYSGVKKRFADANGMSKQQVGAMVAKGIYYVYDGMLVIARVKVK